MQNWTAGYVAEIGYTYGYYSELNPIRAKLAFLYAGLVPPNEQGIHCELGFGQGLSTNINAAALNSKWYGNDFNPSQVSYAQELVNISGANAELTDESFQKFCTRTDLPQFDSIGLHGIWSWVSDDNRKVIVNFIKNSLKVGGVLYISYNSLPGWANFIPMRHLMNTHVETMGSAGNGKIKNIEESINFVRKLCEANPNYIKINPHILERIKNLEKQEKNYLAHEYYNKDWVPMHFTEVSKWLEDAKLQFACSANLLDHIDNINLTTEQIKILGAIDDINLKELVRDLCVNQQFRRDYWVKGSRKLNIHDQIEELLDLKIVLIKPVNEIKLVISGPQGELKLNDEIYKPIINTLIKNNIKKIGQIKDEIKDCNINQNNIFQAIFIMVALGYMAITQEDTSIVKAKLKTEKLNKFILKKSTKNAEINYLASPVIGAGISLTRFQQLFLYARVNGSIKSQEWASYAWSILKSQNQRILIQGKALESDEENLKELNNQALDFEKNHLPILKILGVA
jgi:SAM-dependent methyltransferase